MRRWAWLLSAGTIVGCAVLSDPPVQVTPTPPETYSLFGRPLYGVPWGTESRDSLERRLARARAAFDRDPTDVEATIDWGRSTANLGRYRAAVAIYTEGLAQHPNEPRLRLQRGRLYLILRRFDSAVSDFEQGALTIDDRRPDRMEHNVSGPPWAQADTLESSLWFHAGVAMDLAGDARARTAYERSLEASVRPETRRAVTCWLWRTLVRAGEREHASRILERSLEGGDRFEDDPYDQLIQLYRGRANVETLLASASRRGGTALATIGYGVAGWRWARGERAEAIATLRKVVAGEAWAAWGHIAAEAELKRLGETP